MNISENKAKNMILAVLAVMAAIFDFYSPVPPASAESASSIQDKIEDTLKQKAAVEKQLDTSQTMLEKNARQMDQTRSVLGETEGEIARIEAELDNLDDQITLNRAILESYVREMYWNDQEDEVSVLMFGGDRLDEMTANFDQMANVKEKIMDILSQIKGLKDQTERTNQELSSKKNEHEKMLKEQQGTQYEIKSDINEAQATLAELNAKMDELRSDLSRILGRAYDTGEIKDAIKFANKMTGVRKGFLFGMLSMESGGNPLAGKCTLKNCGMSSGRKSYFEKICDDMGYDDSKCKKMPLSCSPKGYSGTGGAMGAAQFMPDTWWGYRNDIAGATGHNPPDPWNLVDGVMAMALKLKNDEANTSKVSIKNPCTGKSVKVKGEIYASMRYLGWSCYAYTNYAPGVQNLADGYDKL